MLCFSLVAERQIIVAPAFQSPMSFTAPELYPKAKPGIRVSLKNPVIHLDDKVIVGVSSTLLQSRDRSAVQRDGNHAVILRASVRLVNHSVVLVPEHSPNEYGALALLDPGRGEHTSVRFGSDVQILAVGKRKADVYFGTEEVALAAFPGFRAITAYRTSRRWLCFGSNLVQESLRIRFNGQDLVLENLPAS